MEFELKCRTKDVENLTKEINKEETISEVITVVGVEGVGKTALLTYVYNKQKFNVRIWLSFPPDIGHKRMLQQFEQELSNKTKGKDPNNCRCLVVIDRPVSTTTWPKVENQILEKVGKGSKIVLSVTSSWREERIKQGTEPSKEETHGTIELRPLDQKNSKTLFNHVYGLGGRRGTNYKVAEMDHIREWLTGITNGLPLAVVLVAKLMRTMDFGKWEAAADYLKCNSEDNKLRTILTVCIDDLSDELKSCLLYTAGFPENRPIDAHQLVRLWMAEGFLTQQHKLEAEQLGQCYLKELIYRGLLHVHYGGSLPPPGNARRLALHNYNNKFPALDHRLEKLRTVVSYSDDYMDYPYGEWNQNAREHGITILGHKQQKKSSKDEPRLRMLEFLQGSPYLRVINLEGIQVVKKKEKGHDDCALPHEIGEMVHLQYLGVRCRGLKKVPSSVGNLSNLQTIDVRGTSVRKLPESLWKIKTLRHVLGDELAFPTSTGDDLKLMHTLESVTIDHLDDDRCRSTAACWRRGKDGARQRRRRFPFLHRLHVAKLERSRSQGEGLRSVLEGLGSLQALILSGHHILMDLLAAEASTKATASCLQHVESLKLDGQLLLRQDLDYYSCLHSCLLRLTHLVLRSTKIRKEFIPWIGKLPVLAELELLEGSYKHEETTLSADDFDCLTLLKISGLDGLKKISLPSATTRRNKQGINTDVPDHVEVAYVGQGAAGSVLYVEQGAAGSDQQGNNGGEDDQNQISHGEEKDDNPLTQIILEAVKEKNSTKTNIEGYIKDTYDRDLVSLCLEGMVKSGKLRAEPQKNGRKKYFLSGRASPALSVQETVEQNVISSSTDPRQD